MSANIKEWLVVLSFFGCAFALTVVEAAWLNRKKWASFGKSLGFAFLTNFVGLSLGLFVLFSIAAITFMVVFDVTPEKYPHLDTEIIVSFVLGIVFVPLILLFCKRLLLKILQMQSGKPAWLFSLVSSVLIAFVSLSVPSALAYFMF